MLMSVPGLSAEIAQCRMTESKVTNSEKWENPPTNISSMVRFITRYMARVRRLRFFIKRMIDRRFTVTIATDMVRNTASQVMH